MKTVAWAAALSLVLPLPAKAADRMFDLIGSNGRTTTFVDVNSKQLEKDQVSFWALMVNPPPNPLTAKLDVYYIVMKVAVSCDTKSAITAGTVAYTKNDEIAFSSSASSSSVAIIPGSLYDSEYRYFCLGQRPVVSFKMLSHLKEAVAYAESATKPPAGAPSPND